MAKQSGGTRKIIHGTLSAKLKDGVVLKRGFRDMWKYYIVDGERNEFWDLPKEKQKVLESQVLPSIVDSIIKSQGDKPFKMESENWDTIDVYFVKRSVYHIVRNLIRQKGGKYFDEIAYQNFANILSKAKFIKRVDDKKGAARDYYYKYSDGTGRNLYIKVAHEPKQGQKKYFYPYHIDDKSWE